MDTGVSPLRRCMDTHAFAVQKGTRYLFDITYNTARGAPHILGNMGMNCLLKVKLFHAVSLASYTKYHKTDSVLAGKE